MRCTCRERSSEVHVQSVGREAVRCTCRPVGREAVRCTCRSVGREAVRCTCRERSSEVHVQGEKQ